MPLRLSSPSPRQRRPAIAGAALALLLAGTASLDARADATEVLWLAESATDAAPAAAGPGPAEAAGTTGTTGTPEDTDASATRASAVVIRGDSALGPPPVIRQQGDAPQHATIVQASAEERSALALASGEPAAVYRYTRAPGTPVLDVHFDAEQGLALDDGARRQRLGGSRQRGDRPSIDNQAEILQGPSPGRVVTENGRVLADRERPSTTADELTVALIIQSGSDSVARLSQTAAGSEAAILQLGDRNRALLLQSLDAGTADSRNDFALIAQVGDDNRASSYQIGSDLDAITVQLGDGHRALIEQYGVGTGAAAGPASAFIYQSRTSEAAGSTGTGSYASILQTAPRR